MGTLVGHVVPGFVALIIGLWRLFNHIKLHAHNPNSYTSPPWFPTKSFKYLELVFIMAATTLSIAIGNFMGPGRLQRLDPDRTIPSNNLHNFEHFSILMTTFVYAVFSIVLDLAHVRAQYELTRLLEAIVYGQQVLLFHLHSTDHMGLEGRYHFLLELLAFVSLSTTLIVIGLPNSFVFKFVNSVSILFLGLWFIVMGFMLWTPSLIPKGCFMNEDEGHGHDLVVRCSTHEALQRAKSLVNIQFSWLIIAVTVFSVCLYLVLVKAYGEKVQYFSLGDKDEESNDNVESQNGNAVGDAKSFIQLVKIFS